MISADIINLTNAISEKAKSLDRENEALRDEVKAGKKKFEDLRIESERKIARLTKERNSMALVADKAGLL